MDNQLRNRVAAVMQRVLKIEIPPDSNPVRDQLVQWDSIKHLELIMHLEEQFHTRFSLEQATQMNDLESIVAMLEVRQ